MKISKEAFEAYKEAAHAAFIEMVTMAREIEARVKKYRTAESVCELYPDRGWDTTEEETECRKAAKFYCVWLPDDGEWTDRLSDSATEAWRHARKLRDLRNHFDKYGCMSGRYKNTADKVLWDVRFFSWQRMSKVWESVATPFGTVEQMIDARADDPLFSDKTSRNQYHGNDERNENQQQGEGLQESGSCGGTLFPHYD